MEDTRCYRLLNWVPLAGLERGKAVVHVERGVRWACLYQGERIEDLFDTTFVLLPGAASSQEVCDDRLRCCCWPSSLSACAEFKPASQPSCVAREGAAAA